LLLGDCFFLVSRSFGLKTTLDEAGYFAIISMGRIGRSTRLPAQLGHTLLKRVLAQVLQ
jgi:hypothetical protein